MPEAVAFNLPEGRRIGPHYEVVRCLGRGSEGEVYQVIDLETKIRRAAKLFYSERQSKDVVWHAQKLNKLRDCRIVLQYHHTQMIRISGRRVLCLISEFCEGEQLDAWLQQHRGQRLHPYAALHVMHALVQGLEDVHARKEYHGDVHSQNILMTRSGIRFALKLVDFYRWGRSNQDKRQQDVLDVVTVFHECLGGRKHYGQLQQEVRYICAGLKHGLILQRFPTMTALRQHLETFRWQAL